MNKDLIKQLITEIVNESTGIKATDLILRIVEKTIPFDVGCDLVTECIEELVRDKKITELEYTLPRMTYRIKSIYFPTGTSINWK